MFEYVIHGANKKGVAFAEIILRLTKKRIMMLDSNIDPLQASTMLKIKKHRNFFHMFGIDVKKTLERLPFEKFVYTSKAADCTHRKNCIYLVNILLVDEAENSTIIAKLEALDQVPELYVLNDGFLKYVFHYYNMYTLKQLNIDDILFPHIS